MGASFLQTSALSLVDVLTVCGHAQGTIDTHYLQQQCSMHVNLAEILLRQVIGYWILSDVDGVLLVV